jgi:mono/diheme cytochrome c family protein
MRILGLAFGAALVGLGAALAVVRSGVLDVAASSPHPAAARWLLSTTMEHSVRRRASRLVPPPSLAEPDRFRSGFAAYDDMCAGCHGAPGAEPGVIFRGLNPEAPRLVETAAGWSDAELFWIVKHGVRMTGMPAFGATHEDDELWDLVAFLRRLPTLSEREYAALREARDPRGAHEHSRSHRERAPTHPHAGDH